MHTTIELAGVKSSTDLPKGVYLIVRDDDITHEYPPRRLWQDAQGGWHLSFDRYGAGRMGLARCVQLAMEQGYDEVRVFGTEAEAFDWMYGVAK